MVKVRFAPSPTGYLHIGGARTALFNWMYAKSQGGQFILRIEDTDRVRSKKEFVDEILDSMNWLGLSWDELYYQSDRFDLYRSYAQKLLEEGKAYAEGEAIVLETPDNKEIKFFDLIRGEIKFNTSTFIESKTIRKVDASVSTPSEDALVTLKDQVLIKSDGSPTYSFACVVDDALMEISHVIRGEDHISNTPKQILMYEVLGFKPPKFAHLPLILDDERARLSKRAGAVAVTDYRRQGFLPEAIVNYLMLLGWSPGGNQEMVGLEEAVKKFSIKNINKAGAAFSIDKLKWLNSQYIKQMPADKLTQLLVPFLQEKGYVRGDVDVKKLEYITELFKGRMSTLVDFLDWTDFIFLDQISMQQDLQEKFCSREKEREFKLLSEKLSQLTSFEAASAEKAFRDLVQELGIKASDLVHPVRVALTGRAVGPGLFETMAVLGKEKTVKRLTETFTARK